MPDIDREALMQEIDEAAVVQLIENNWYEFCEWSGGEESAQTTLDALKTLGGLV